MNGPNSSQASTQAHKAVFNSANFYFLDSLIPDFLNLAQVAQKSQQTTSPKWFQASHFSYINLGWRFLVGGIFFAYTKWRKTPAVEHDKPQEPILLPEHKLWLFSSIFIPILRIGSSSLKEQHSDIAQLVGLASQIVFFGSVYFYIRKSLTTLGNHFKLIFWDESNELSWGRFKFYGKRVAFVFLLEMIATIALSQIIKLIFKNEADHKSENEKQIQESLRGATVFLTIVSVLLFAPVFEELIYRRSMLKVTNFHTSVLFSSALIFGMAHLEVTKETIFHIIPYFVGGLVFAWSYKRFRNIWISIFAHFMHNFTVLLIVLLRA